MPRVYKRQSLRCDHFVDLKPYRRPNQMGPARDLGRETERHAESLKRELADAWADADGLIAARDADGVGRPGQYIDFETLPNQPLPDLTWSSQGIRLAAAARRAEGETSGTIFVRDEQQDFLNAKLDSSKKRRDGKESVSTCGSRCCPHHEKK